MMEKRGKLNKKKFRGYTIVEAIVSVIIAGILFLIVGQILIHTRHSQRQGETAVEINRDLRVCRKNLELEIRKAMEFINFSNNQIRFIAFNPEVNNNTNTVKISLNNDNNTIDLEKNTPTDNINKILLTEVENLEFKAIDNSPITTISVYIEQEKVFEPGTGHTESNTDEFIIKSRNIRK
ncbi:MAG: type II secretion system protein [Elusimicrobiota bacterium]